MARLHDCLYDSLLAHHLTQLLSHLGILEWEKWKMHLFSELPRSGRDLQQ